MKRLVVGTAFLAFLGLSACTREAPQSSGAVAMTPGQIVAGRQAAFRLSAGNLQLMKAAADESGDAKAFAGPARGLAKWAAALPGMFPEGTGPGAVQTHARPEIWSDRATFDQKAADYEAAATRLAELGEAGDMAGALRQWDAVRASCGACHDLFRAEDRPAQ
jgi:cytochrome c556